MTTENKGVVILRGDAEKTESNQPKSLDMAGFQAFAAAVARLENKVLQREVEAPRPVVVSSLETLRAVPDAPPSETVEPEEPSAVIARFPGPAKPKSED